MAVGTTSQSDRLPTTGAGSSRTKARKPRRHGLQRYLLLPALLTVLVFFIYPIGVIVWGSFDTPSFGLQNYTKLLHDNVTVTVVIRTFVTAAWVTVATLILSYPYAYAMTRVSGTTRRVMMLVVLVPFWTSLMARTFAWYVLEQQGGLIQMFFELFGMKVVLLGTIVGVGIAMIQVMLPFMVLPLYSGLVGIDHRLIDAAESLGAKPSKAFRDVYLPLSLPAIVSGTSLVFIITLGFYVTPALLGSPDQAMLSQIIAVRVTEILDFAGAGALGLILFVFTLIVVMLLARLGSLTEAAGTKRTEHE